MHITLLGRAECTYTKKLSVYFSELGARVSEANSTFVGEKFPDSLNKQSGDLLLSFRSHFVVPENVLAGFATSLNFHMGPPWLPGFGSASFALWNGDSTFAVTCHKMTPRLDSGEILAVRRFQIKSQDTLQSLLERTHWHAFELAKYYANYESFPETSSFSGGWTGKNGTLKHLKSLAIIRAEDSEEVRKRKIRAFNHPDWPIQVEDHLSS